jgi:dephospho-CoA kinase
MLKVGLTGSIAVGKSYVTSVFARLGAFVMDADQTARQVVAPGTDGLAAIVKAFGASVLHEDGSLNREKLGAIVFADASKRQQLNEIAHPLVLAAQDEQLRVWEAAAPQGVAIVDAALMIESGGYKRFDKLIVVHCRPELQLSRLMQRNGITRAEAERRISAQMSQKEKMAYADFLIDTSDGFPDTEKQVTELFLKIKELAQAKGRENA